MPSDGVTVVITYRALPGHADTARDELAALIGTVVGAEPDCRGIRMLRDTTDPHRILLVEEWTDADVFTGPHMRTPHLQAFMQRAGAFIAGPPEIQFWQEVATVPATRAD